MKLILIQAGKFTMGSPEDEIGRKYSEGPQEEVTISKPFYMGVYEVTQVQWRAIMGTKPWARRERDHPGVHAASGITWDDANKFCEILSKETGKKVTLPRETQWEYACRAGSKTTYCFGNDTSRLRDYAWFNRNTQNERYAHAPGQKKPNAWGLYDMHGNVGEWCNDWWTEKDYGRSKVFPPEEVIKAKSIIVRGGSWGDDPDECRSAYRDWNRYIRHPFHLFGGFRVIIPAGCAD